MEKVIDYAKMLTFKENTELELELSDFIMPQSLLNSIRFQDLALLLNDCIGP